MASDTTLVDLPEIAPFDPSKKKKKKKVSVHNHVEDSLCSLVERADMLSLSERASEIKKSRLRGINSSSNVCNDAIESLYDGGLENEEGRIPVQSRSLLEGNEHDYQYKELLQRIYCLLHENDPHLVGDRRRTVLRPPQILREGTKKIVFVNFMEICKAMHRQPEHIINFMSKESGTFMSLDGENRLIVKEMLAPQILEDLLQKYLSEYVLCSCCRSPDTILSKKIQLHLLQCEMCGTERTVSPVSAGYSTRVDRRKPGT